jgi:hypothetical protein
MGGILPFAPLDLVDLLLDFQGLEIIEFGLMRLELGVKLVLAALFLRHTAMIDVHKSQEQKWSMKMMEESDHHSHD